MRLILVVDDEFDILLALEMLLQEEGFEVVTASNGKQALERLAERLPDVVLMDVMMPVLYGPETILKMKADVEYALIPIVLMSGVNPAFSQDDYPYSAFIRKPFLISNVLESIEAVLKKGEELGAPIL